MNPHRTLADPVALTEGLALDAGPRGGRIPFDRDPLVAALADGSWTFPEAGQPIAPNGPTWQPVRAGADGAFTDSALRRGGYVWIPVKRESPETVLLAAAGHSMVYVDGEPRAGDPYGYGYLHLPIRLKAGTTGLLFAVGRGRLSAKLLPVPQTPVVNPADATLPDFVVGERQPVWGAVHVVNPSDAHAKDLFLQAQVGRHRLLTRLPAVSGLSVRKCGFQIPTPDDAKPGDVKVALTLFDGNRRLGETTLTLGVRTPRDSVKRTFVSAIDGSVQYWAALPAQEPSTDNALVLTLHGASVEAIGQANAYGAKAWATLAAPTNRRPYGFDWEDWGRLDALEVLEQARKVYPASPARTCLTGHSMGGHGTWSIGSLYPDRFAAIAPSAGWISFATYTGTPIAQRPPLTDPLAELVRRASSGSDTLLRAENILQQRVYVLHGDADDNVPVSEARQMRAVLSDLKHPAVGWHEERGAGHWWDGSPDPGADCVDWKPMFALFSRARLESRPDRAALVTTNPAVSARAHWLTIVQQSVAMRASRADLRYADGAITGTVENVQRLAIDTAGLPGPLTHVVLGGSEVRVSGGGAIHLLSTKSGWRQVGPPSAGEKRPERGGPFKQALQRRMVFVYGTVGAPEENVWARAKARYDAESWLYRGNGAVDVLADVDATPGALKDRGVLLYGNADTNKLWRPLLPDCPIDVRRGGLRVGRMAKSGTDLLAVFLRPSAGSSLASVAVVAPTGTPSQRLADRLPYFTSGVAYPDWCIASTRVLREGVAGILGAGYFGNDWRLGSGETVWR